MYSTIEKEMQKHKGGLLPQQKIPIFNVYNQRNYSFDFGVGKIIFLIVKKQNLLEAGAFQNGKFVGHTHNFT